MVIGIDLRCLPSDGSPGAGVAHAARALVNKLIEHGDQTLRWSLFLPQGASPYAEDRLAKEKTSSAVHIIRLQGATGAALRRAMRRNPCDLLFVPSGAVAPALFMPVVPWVHDVAIFDHPEWFSEDFLQRTISTNLFRRGIKRARHVLAVSEFTKRELCTHFGLDSERVTVTHEGGDSVLAALDGEALHAAKQQAKQRVANIGIVHPFVLCMGTLEPRKNIPFLLEVWMEARSKFARPIDLIIAGKDGWKLEPIRKALDLGQVAVAHTAARLHRIEMPTDEVRRDLLLAADIVAVPSLYEGFGLVALEAMQAKTLVMASRIGGLSEVVDTAGILLPPQSKAEWVEALVRLVDDEVSREHLAREGKSRSQGMTWQHAAKVAFNVLTQRPR